MNKPETIYINRELSWLDFDNRVLALAKEKGWGVEILSHPGGIREPEDIAKLTNRADIAFLTSPNRDLEGDMLKRIHA